MADKQPIVTVTVPAKVLADLKQGIEKLQADAAPYIIPLTNKQRSKRLKMGAKSVAFVTKTFNYASATPNFAPFDIDVPGLGTNLATTAGLAPVIAALKQLAFDLEGTAIVSSGSAKAAGLAIYNQTHGLADRNVAGAQAAFNDMHLQFVQIGTDSLPSASDTKE